MVRHIVGARLGISLGGLREAGVRLWRHVTDPITTMRSWDSRRCGGSGSGERVTNDGEAWILGNIFQSSDQPDQLPTPAK